MPGIQPLPATPIVAPAGVDVMLAITAGAVVPAWVMVSLPPCWMGNTNFRVFGPKLGATFSVTVPVPTPAAPETTVMAFGSLFKVFQAHEPPSITLRTSVLPLGGTVAVPVLKEALQFPGS